MSALVASLAVVAGLGLTACSHVPHSRHESADADARLAAALAQWDEAHAEGMNNGAVMDDERVVVDSGAVKLRIEQISLEFPRHVPTLLMCTQLAFDAGEHERAAAYADRVLALQPDNTFAGIYRARAALSDGNLAKAKDVLRRQLALTPDSGHLHETLAGVEYYCGDLEACEREIVLAERFGATPWRLALHRGLVAEKRGDAAEARRQYEISSKLCPAGEQPKGRLRGVSPPEAPPAQ